MQSISLSHARRDRQGSPRRSRRLLRVIGVIALLYVAGAAPQSADLATHATPPRPYGRLPLAFETNRGQTDSQVQFLARGAGYQVFLTRSEAVLAFSAPAATESRPPAGVPTTRPKAPPVSDMKQTFVRMALEGANPDPHGVGLEQLPGKVNYLRGNDPGEWQTNVPMYAKVRYEAVYPGIDLVYYGHSRQLEYDFVVAPGADPDTITLSFDSAGSVDLDAAGDLLLTTAAGPVRFQKPIVYQERDGSRQSVAGGYVRKGTNRIGFRVADYDTTRPLIIDPVLSYATYLGGSDGDSGADIAVDRTGAAYVLGTTSSLDFPTQSPLQATADADGDAFVAKLSPDGTALVYATYLGGSDAEFGVSIAVDRTGAAYVAGQTLSLDFPTRSPLQPALAGVDDWFVAKLTPDGTALVYATYLGGSGDEGTDVAIAVDGSGSAYVGSATNSTDFPLKSPLQAALAGESDAYIVKLTADGSALVYGTFLGGSGIDTVNAVAVDANGAAVVAGFTNSPDFPTKSAFQSMLNDGAPPDPSRGEPFGDAFVAKLTPDGSTLVYATYLGGSSHESATSIAVDGAGAAYITGDTGSEDFPTVSPLQPVPTRAADVGGQQDLFVAKLTVDGSALAYSTYFSGTFATGIAVDAAGAAYVTGFIAAGFNFIVVHPVQPHRSETGEGFLAKFAAGGSALVYSFGLDSGPFGGPAVAVDTAGAAYVTGTTMFLNFPTTNAVQPTPGGGGDGFVLKLAPASTDVPVPRREQSRRAARRRGDHLVRPDSRVGRASGRHLQDCRGIRQRELLQYLQPVFPGGRAAARQSLTGRVDRTCRPTYSGSTGLSGESSDSRIRTRISDALQIRHCSVHNRPVSILRQRVGYTAGSRDSLSIALG